jgi:hypothetical protein
MCQMPRKGKLEIEETLGKDFGGPHFCGVFNA